MKVTISLASVFALALAPSVYAHAAAASQVERGRYLVGSWLTPTSELSARFAKLSLQFDF